MKTAFQLVRTLAIAFSLAMATTANGQNPTIGDLCTVKGQESNYLRGVGLVVGLKGTGDPDLPQTLSSLGKALESAGLTMPKDISGQYDLKSLSGAKNATLVYITAEIPSSGSRQGTKLNCRVSSFYKSASLEGGTLISTPLTGGPVQASAEKMPVFAMAQGTISEVSRTSPTSGVVRNGCQMEQDFINKFAYLEKIRKLGNAGDLGGSITQAGQIDESRDKNMVYVDLVMRPNHASFVTAQEIAEAISTSKIYANARMFADETDADLDARWSGVVVPTAMDQVTIKVPVPSEYSGDKISTFMHALLTTQFVGNVSSNVVMLNPKTGVIIIGENVLFKPAAVSTGDFTIETGSVKEFFLEDNGEVNNGEKAVPLKKLQRAFNQLQASNTELMNIIIELDRSGNLFGELRIWE